MRTVYKISYVSPMNFGGFCAQIITPAKLECGTEMVELGSNDAVVDRGALQLALNVLRRCGKTEVADALASASSLPDSPPELSIKD